MSVTPPRPEELATQPADLPALADAPTLEAPQVYKPLSLLALLALLLGSAYAVLVLVGGLMPFARAYPRSFVVLMLAAPILGGLGAVLMRKKGAVSVATLAAAALGGVVVLMGLGGLVTFSAASPWELGAWSYVLLFAAVLVSVLALAQIRSSEGALAGRGLARWGLYLSLFFGGYYLLYLGGNAFAVSKQAQVVTDGFIEKIRTDDLPQAFRDTIRPGGRPSGANLREEIELGFNSPRGRDLGDFSAFSTSRLVQGIRLGNTKAEGVKKVSASTELAQTGYQALVRYEVTNDLGTFDVVVIAHSIEVAGKREWQVIGPQCRIEKAVRETDQGNEIGQAGAECGMFCNRWQESLATKQFEAAYLLTLPLKKRTVLGKALLMSRPDLAALAGPTSAMALHSLAKENDELTRGTEEFKSGKTIVDSTNFVTFLRDNASAKKAQIEQAHDFFGNRNRVPVALEVVPVQFATVKRVGDEVEVIQPARLQFEGIAGVQPRYSIECEIVCRGKPGERSPSFLDNYRIEKVRLGRASVAPSQEKGPPRGQVTPQPTPQEQKP